MTGVGLVRMLLGFGLLAAACDPRPPVEAPAPPVSPDAAPTLPLYEQLYAGEYGPNATVRGDRVRILVWLRALGLRPIQAESLRLNSHAVRAGLRELDADQAARDAAEIAAFGPTYDQLTVALAQGEPDAALREAANTALVDAHKTLGHPEGRRWTLVRAVLGRAESFLDQLEAPQRDAMRHALFFLRKPISPGIAPEFYEGLVGAAWRAGDFGSMERVRQGAVDPGSLDIGGLWMVNGEDESDSLTGLRLQVLTSLALAHPGLIPAIEVMEGRRAPLDFDTPVADPEVPLPPLVDPGTPTEPPEAERRPPGEGPPPPDAPSPP